MDKFNVRRLLEERISTEGTSSSSLSHQLNLIFFPGSLFPIIVPLFSQRCKYYSSSDCPETKS